MNKNYQLGVVGYPIKHSLSPTIHQQFAKQFGLNIDYQKYSIEPEKLNAFVADFFDHGGNGLNITLPHKQNVIDCVDQLTETAKQAHSVNTLFINDEGKLVGDTTDGYGLLLDLNRLNFSIKNKNILVVGAGGACQAILPPLLKVGAHIQLLNRSENKVIQMIKRFSHLGKIEIFTLDKKVDGVISTISEFNPLLMSTIPSVIKNDTFCYDLNYANRAAEFNKFVTELGCHRFSDGLGMLIGQAAQSFKIWTGHLPDISKIKINLPDSDL